jgi:hypothetical protein
MTAITDIPAANAIARFREGFGTRFLITVDTEEEFAWNEPFQRTGHTLNHVARLRDFQIFCEKQGIVPVYVMDFPIATCPLTVAVLGEAAAARRAELGIHLHPWVTPPHDEVVNDRNSFAGNLPPELEEAKFERIKQALSSQFGVEPRIFRAGRYGVGPETHRVLARNAIAIDSSVRARFDYSAHHGPDFSHFPALPYWVGGDRSILELPLTTVYGGALRSRGDWLYPVLRRAPRIRGALSRLGLLDRIALTPEGVDAKDAIRGIDRALEEGLPLLVMSFHSPSLDPGHTPYVRSEDDLDRFYGWWKKVLSHCARNGIRPTDLGEIMQAVEV